MKNIDEAIKEYAMLQLEQRKILDALNFSRMERWEQDEFFMSVNNYIEEVVSNG